MSTSRTLLGDSFAGPSLDITESSAQFDITSWPPDLGYTSYTVSFDRLTADQTIEVALKILQFVLYSYPEKHAEIVRQAQELRF